MSPSQFLSKVLRKLGINVLINHAYDMARFVRAKNGRDDVTSMDSESAAMHLLRLMHSLEKGMALPKPMPGFGISKALNLKRQADAYLARFGSDEVFRLCMATLASHQEFQAKIGGRDAGFDLSELEMAAEGVQAGAHEVSKKEYLDRSRLDFKSFALGRSSIRNFTGEPVPECDLLESIFIATKSPSVCNRACARAYYSNDRDVIGRVLARQSGNSGFGNLAGAVLVVTADMRAFYKSGERNQGWIDGGLFAMTLNYALHSKGYGVCMLNWSMDAVDDLALRRDLGISPDQSVVMMMVVGHLPDKFSVTVSPHRDISKFAFRVS